MHLPNSVKRIFTHKKKQIFFKKIIFTGPCIYVIYVCFVTHTIYSIPVTTLSDNRKLNPLDKFICFSGRGKLKWNRICIPSTFLLCVRRKYISMYTVNLIHILCTHSTSLWIGRRLFFNYLCMTLNVTKKKVWVTIYWRGQWFFKSVLYVRRKKNRYNWFVVYFLFDAWMIQKLILSLDVTENIYK